jgi:hypothetical protein
VASTGESQTNDIREKCFRWNLWCWLMLMLKGEAHNSNVQSRSQVIVLARQETSNLVQKPKIITVSTAARH